MTNIEILKNLRKKQKITFEELAVKSGIPIRTIENIFHGITKHPRIDTMQAIERALGITEEPQEMTEEEKQLASLIAQLTDEETKELSNFVDYIISKRK